MKIKSSQKLQIQFYGLGAQNNIVVRCRYKDLYKTLDQNSQSAIQQALGAIFQEPCRGISGQFSNRNLQVDLLD